MKKKRFGLTASLDKGLTDTINIVENSQKMYYNAVVPLDRIETDPENPRKLAISVEEVKNGQLVPGDLFEQKVCELEKLTELAESIKASELINPIVVYKYFEKYRIATGERRYLATILTQKTEIDARIFHVKPEQFELKLMQWYENTEREELTLFERINNIKEILNAYLQAHPELTMTSTVIKNIIGLSKTQAKYYLAIINAPSDILTAIECGKINNLDKAILISSCPDSLLRHNAIEACAIGASWKELKELLEKRTNNTDIVDASITRQLGKKMSVNLGRTFNPLVVQNLIKAAIKAPEFQKFSRDFEMVNWTNHQAVSRAFKKLLKLIEDEEACIEN